MASCSFRMSAAHLLRSPLSEKVPRSFPLSSSKGRKRDILSQREGVSAKPRHLLQTLDHRAFHGLSERIRPLDLPAVFRPPSLPAGVRDSVQILFQRLSRCVRGPGLLAVQAEFPPDFLQCFPLQALRREPGSGSASLLDGVQADQCLPDGVRRLSSVCVPFVPEAVGREGEATRPFGCAHDGAAELSVDARFRTTCTCSFVGFADP